MRPSYRIYPTLLDGFSFYKRSEDENAKQDMLDRINRVERPKTPPMLRGIAFNGLVDDAACGLLRVAGDVAVEDVTCPAWILEAYAARFRDAARQVYVEAPLETSYGSVLIYGFMDETVADTGYEIKTTSKYEFPKYLHNWQHPAYLHCMRHNGVDVHKFVYMATDFRQIYEEAYRYREEDTDRLVSVCNEFIEFLEINRDRITDRRIFCLPMAA
jgi:hypothetical protein